MRMGEDDANGTGTTGDPSPGNAQSRWQPRAIKVRGKEVIVDSEEKANELMQKGAAAEQRFSEAKKMREEAEAEKADIARERARLQRLANVDDMLTADPEKRDRVNRILNGDGPEPEGSDDPILRELEIRDRRHNAQIAELTQQLNRLSTGLNQGIGSIRRDRTLDSEERQLKRTYPQLATDERLDEARQLADKRGLSLDEAFRISTFDEMPEFVRGQVITELGVDPTKIGPQRGADLVLDGIGPVKDEDTLNRLFEEDPERYARLRPQMRAWRLKRSGKEELPR